MALIYISSTYSDLMDAREAVYRALRKMRHDVIAMEDYVAMDQRPLEKCLSDVANCDIYIGIFAWRYGYIPPNQERSITELEFREAVRAGKPCLLFLLHEEAPWPRNLIDRDGERIEAVRTELCRDYMVSFFRTSDELATAVSVAVASLDTAPLGKGVIHMVDEFIAMPHWSSVAEVSFSITNLSRTVVKLARLLLHIHNRKVIDKVRLKKAGAPLREFNLFADVSGVDEVDLLRGTNTQFVLEPSHSDAFCLSFTAPEGYLYTCKIHARLDDLAANEQVWIEGTPFQVEYPIRSVDVLRASS